ncbi:MAG: hypothetical protein COY75_01705 [Nitrospirae bacterium CG_4_10_14_0_8_um_filter_41_23]|nr:MAG: hypothetical protein COY75_01705 [Nitrospirae bacterium CG_4_10_14_0_8_um_filter_41_23]
MAKGKIPSNLVSKLTYLEREIRKLKQSTKKEIVGKQLRKSKSLRGLLKGVRIEPDEIEEAKRSLFRTNY